MESLQGVCGVEHDRVTGTLVFAFGSVCTLDGFADGRIAEIRGREEHLVALEETLREACDVAQRPGVVGEGVVCAADGEGVGVWDGGFD